jgi:ribosome maturation protein SDO1
MDQRKTFEKEHFNINIARLKKGGQTFEININPDLAVDFKEGKEVDVEDILKSQEIFFNATKGDLASEDIMKELFSSEDKLEIAKIILQKGEIQLTAEHRAKVREDKRKKLVNIIHRNAIDPKTQMPHPVQRIENAFEEAKIKLEEFKSVEDQVNDVVKKLQVILPIKFDHKKVEVKIDAAHAHSVFAIAKKYGVLKENTWLNDGSWFGIVEIPAGLQNEFFDEINGSTHGRAITKILD